MSFLKVNSLLTDGHFSVRMNVAYKHAEVAELADAADSKSAAREGVGVRLPSSAPIPEACVIRGFFCFGFGFLHRFRRLDPNGIDR